MKQLMAKEDFLWK